MEQQKTKWQSFWELVRFAIIAVAIVIPIRIFIAQPFIVSGSSMVPTFQDGQYLIVDEISYRIGTPQRDDVVIFRYPNDQTKFFIKRIIGLPGETVDVKGNDVTITNKAYPTGLKLDESFIKNTSDISDHRVLSDNEFYVMGDNRPRSSDSREFGQITQESVIGQVFYRYFPPSKAGTIPNPFPANFQSFGKSASRNQST